jgi:nucleoside-diphosphate-sugar epimerase
MTTTTALVTGASGFIGSRVVQALHSRHIRVRAGVHRQSAAGAFPEAPGIEQVPIDILDRDSLMRALERVDTVYHFAALVDPGGSRQDIYRTNVAGTRNVWECAAACGVKKALYCSSAAVYGLLARSSGPISEEVRPRSVEPYGNSKLMGEATVFEIAACSGPPTIVIRPVAVFGPGEHTPFGKQLRDAAFSRILLAGGFQNKSFSFVHVDDVAGAAVHLMLSADPGQVFNVAVQNPIPFEDALQTYIRVLGRAGVSTARTRRLAWLSATLHKFPGLSTGISRLGGTRFAFPIWHPGFDRTYSAAKLLGTSYRFQKANFEDVLFSCIMGSALPMNLQTSVGMTE